MQQYANLRLGVSVVLFAVIYQLALRDGWSLVGIALAIAFGVLVMWLFAVIWHRYRIAWNRRFLRTSKRLMAGEGDAVIAELAARRAAGDRSVPTAIALAAAYAYVGRGDDAEQLADEAIRGVVAANTCARRDLSSRMQCEYARLARYDALVVQGRFAEAAHSLRPGASEALQPNFMIALVAWAFFLANDAYNASIVLREVQLPGAFNAQARLLSPNYHLMVLYMRYLLLGENTLPMMRKLAGRLQHWEDSVARHAHNPYGARVRAILDDLHPLLRHSADGIIR